MLTKIISKNSLDPDVVIRVSGNNGSRHILRFDKIVKRSILVNRAREGR